MKLTPAKLWMNCVAQLDFVKQFSYQMQSQKMPIVAINFKNPTNVFNAATLQKSNAHKDSPFLHNGHGSETFAFCLERNVFKRLIETWWRFITSQTLFFIIWHQ